MAPVRGIASNLTHRTVKDPLMQCLLPSLSQTRFLATETSLPSSQTVINPFSSPYPLRRPPPIHPKVLTTLYSFPSLEPLGFTHYSSNQLALPLRKDILHRAVIFEADSARQGTASTKHRSQVHGSNRKIRPQKGTGRARLGNVKSPMLRGGGVAFGPHPRDFSTKLPRKIYDLAWRTALSYRYSRGELVVIDGDGFEDIEMAEPRWVRQILERNGMGNADGRSLIVTEGVRPNLFGALAGAGEQGRVKTKEDVDVKDLLELGRIVVEKSVLDWIFERHSSDIVRSLPSAVYT
ncbi:54S ribosomal protein, mitochondrial [Thelotrema lepadinum]|nr:54S ribosomal protein, mitochondrial [Thelotrema lepadinum]